MKLLIFVGLLALVAGIGCHAASSESPGLAGSDLQSANNNVAETESASLPSADDDAQRISLEDAKKAYDKGEAVFVDTRSDTFFENEHIRGAINVPASDFDDHYKEVPKNKKIIAYCSWPSEHTSARVVLQFEKKGYKNAFALVGGTAAWKNAGYPMEGSGVANADN